MCTHPITAASLVCIGGFALSAHGVEPEFSDRVRPLDAGATYYVYYNAATREQAVTRVAADAQDPSPTAGRAGPDQGRDLVWASTEQSPCAGAGFGTAYYMTVDAPCSITTCRGMTVLDFADIEYDRVIDCLRVTWVTSYRDTDVNSDGVPDGIEGFGARWTVWEADNGREEDFDIKEPAVDIVMNRLLGNLPSAPDGEVARFIMDIDLSSVDGSMDRTFELGDTDGDPGMAVSHNPFIGVDHPDLDSNGYFDWSWSVRFFVPGRDDIDGDGVVDGTTQQGVFDGVGIEIAAPEGQAVQEPGGAWSWDIDTGIGGAGIGSEDAWSFYRDDGAFGYLQFINVFWFGGFDCSSGPTGSDSYTPYGNFYYAMYGPADIDCCPSDYNCDGSLDFFDVSAFIMDFNAMNPDADINLDGVWDFFDVSLFIQDFTTGCP